MIGKVPDTWKKADITSPSKKVKKKGSEDLRAGQPNYSPGRSWSKSSWKLHPGT